MLGYIFLSLLIGLIIWVIYQEYQNEKAYQRKREAQRQQNLKQTSIKPKETPPVTVPAKEIPKPLVETIPEIKEEIPSETPIIEPTVKEEITPPEVPLEQLPEIVTTTPLPECNYPPFNHTRLLEMGLSENEAKEFIGELITQVDAQIPLIEEALQIPDFHKLERLTHSIKGSATNLGTGGLSDLLVDYNTYLKKNEELPIINAYQGHLKRCLNDLKEQYA
ncbi:MAG: Hpt domain-containing protein [Campylobacterales bacterium]|nr:Hpt domain-containing protein [Campylobacterales bacterium]